MALFCLVCLTSNFCFIFQNLSIAACVSDKTFLFYGRFGQTLLPLQRLESGQSLSSTRGPGHWLSSSSLETGTPEYKSKQARKRRWVESIWLALMTPAVEWLSCREEDGTQGEQGVHSDHSLSMTKQRKGKAGWCHHSTRSLCTLLSLPCFLTFTVSRVTLQSSVMAKAGGQNQNTTICQSES